MKIPCALPTRTGAINPRMDADSSSIEDTLNRVLRSELRATAALGGAQGKDAKG